MGKAQCHFCRNNVVFIDHKHPEPLKRYLTTWGKIKPAQVTGTCSKHQRKLTKAIKRARFLALMPYISR